MLSLGCDIGEVSAPRARAVLNLTVTDGTLDLSIAELVAHDKAPVSLSSVIYAGNDLIGSVIEPDSPELVIDANPGRVNKTWAYVAATASAGLVHDQLYVLQYEIVETGPVSLFFTDSLGPWASTNLNRNVGVHTYLLRGRAGSQTDIVRVQGDITFGSVSLKRAEWSVALPDRGPNLVANSDPETLALPEQIASPLLEEPEIGEDYELSYTVEAITSGGLFANTTSGAPFNASSLPATVGTHTVTVTAETPHADAVMRMVGSGEMTVSNVSFRKVLKGNDALTVTLMVGDTELPFTVRTRAVGELHVAPWGSAKTGTGAQSSPFKTVAQAMAVAQPGDTIYLRPGVYAPFNVSVGGTNDNRTKITTLPGEERQAIVDGGGVPGGGISIYGVDHVDILNLTIRNITSQSAVQMGGGHHIRVEGCQIHTIDRSAILCHGTNAVAYRDGPDSSIHMTNILIKGNDCYDCYRVGAGNEVISVAAGVSNIIIEDNDIHDSLQYGIDLKVGVQDAIVRRNRIWGVKEHGIYLDAAKKFLRRIQVYDNWVWGPGRNHVANQPMLGLNGIALAREAEGDASQSELSDINIYNNRVFGMRQQGILAFGHGSNGGDQPDGSISNISIRFNTVYDCGKDGAREELRVADWTSGAYKTNGIVSNFEVIGNILYRPGGGTVFGAQAMINNPEFTYERNVTADPLFANPDRAVVIPDGFLPVIELPDFSIGAGSLAIDTTRGTDAAAPFDKDANGITRGDPANAGALE